MPAQHVASYWLLFPTPLPMIDDRNFIVCNDITSIKCIICALRSEHCAWNAKLIARLNLYQWYYHGQAIGKAVFEEWVNHPGMYLGAFYIAISPLTFMAYTRSSPSPKVPLRICAHTGSGFASFRPNWICCPLVNGFLFDCATARMKTFPICRCSQSWISDDVPNGEFGPR